jgi:methionyl-tRNA synthetase
MILPFMPETADKIFEQLGILKIEKEKLQKEKNFEEIKKWKKILSDIKVVKGKALFPRI